MTPLPPRTRAVVMWVGAALAATAGLAAQAATHAGPSRTSASRAGATASVAAPAAPRAQPGTQGRYVSFPSFLTKGEVLCLDELDFNAFAASNRFNTRGSTETCTRVGELTRVVVLAQTGTKSQIRVVGGPLDANVGWTNGHLPVAGPRS